MAKAPRRQRLWLAIALTVLSIVLTAAAYEFTVASHMYPQDAPHEDSNLAVKGVVTSIETNYRRDGLGPSCYHIFRYFIRLNITEVVWTEGYLPDWVAVAAGNATVDGRNTVCVGYDSLDAFQLEVGHTVECKGNYAPYADSPYSYIITVASTITESCIIP